MVAELNRDLFPSSLLVVLTPLPVPVLSLIVVVGGFTLDKDHAIRLIVKNCDKLALLLLDDEVFQKKLSLLNVEKNLRCLENCYEYDNSLGDTHYLDHLLLSVVYVLGN